MEISIIIYHFHENIRTLFACKLYMNLSKLFFVSDFPFPYFPHFPRSFSQRTIAQFFAYRRPYAPRRPLPPFPQSGNFFPHPHPPPPPSGQQAPANQQSPANQQAAPNTPAPANPQAPANAPTDQQAPPPTQLRTY